MTPQISFANVEAAATGGGDGSVVLGWLILAGIVWFVCWLFSSKPKGYDITSVTHGQIKPR